MIGARHTSVVNGIEQSWLEYGDPARPTVMLLHALGIDATDWEVVAAELSSDHHVVAPDARGHGESSRTEEYGFDLMCDDVVALIEHLGVAPVDLVGHSMGGTVSYLVTELRPDLVRRLVTEDTPPPDGSAQVPDPPDELPEELPFDGRVLRPLLQQLREPDPRWWGELEMIAAPVLVIAGGPESHVDQSRLGRVAERVPNGRLVDLGGGHYVHGVNTAEYVALVRDFLAS